MGKHVGHNSQDGGLKPAIMIARQPLVLIYEDHLRECGICALIDMIAEDTATQSVSVATLSKMGGILLIGPEVGTLPEGALAEFQPF